MVPRERIEGSELHPPLAQFHRGVAPEAADVGAHHRDAEQTEA